MKIKIAELWEGWKNHLLPPEKLKEEIKRVSGERLSICRECPHNSINKIPGAIIEYCTICSCPLKAKTKCLHCSCPLTPTKWGPILDQKTSLELQGEIKQEDDE